ncbi:unnamed protein product [Phyllotreta striolata]|uniref:Actin maturation protease n=1 Tax=Phyllotreta striolata TaxID=444603 RepID=A0A9N9TZE1_PHYSR|nr:unnamed protein product [Phyllotreta striolata]
MDFSWAESYPEVHKVCTLFQMSELSNPVKFKYRQLDQFLQDGPKCGLIALAMLAGAPTSESVQDIFESAKRLNFTYNGEMFSVLEMAELAAQHLPSDTKVQVYRGHLNNDYIKSFLLEGGVMLVPYDKAQDNSPGLCKGHKAHWAAICGCVLTENQDFYVLARHGKAKNVAVWKLKTLADSNSQLVEFSPERKLDKIEYKLPEGGINGEFGLNSQSVLINL